MRIRIELNLQPEDQDSGNKMANPNIENETLTKGVRLTVIVEYSFDNLIAVFLFHNGREFRGVLLENDTGYVL